MSTAKEDPVGVGSGSPADRVWESTRRAIEHQGLELQEPIGSGTTSAVFGARERVGSGWRRLVVKVLAQPRDENDEKGCFLRAIRVLESEHVPADVLPTLKYFEGDGSGVDDFGDPTAPTRQAFLVAEWVEGRPILEAVAGSPPMPIPERLRLIERGFQAIGRLHASGIIHGNIAPEHVVVQEGGGIRLIGIGSLRPIRSPGIRSLARTWEDAPRHHAEDPLDPQDRLAIRVDLRAFASVAFTAMTDRSPVGGPEDKKALRKVGVPADAAGVLRKALRQEASAPDTHRDLYQSADQIVDDLRASIERRTRRDARRGFVREFRPRLKRIRRDARRGFVREFRPRLGRIRRAARKKQLVIDSLIGFLSLAAILSGIGVVWWQDRSAAMAARDDAMRRYDAAESRAKEQTAALGREREERRSERTEAEREFNELSATLIRERQSAKDAAHAAREAAQSLAAGLSAAERSAAEAALAGKKEVEAERERFRLRITNLEWDLAASKLGPRFMNFQGMTMVRIEPGEFLMGSRKGQIDALLKKFPELKGERFDDEQPQHPVKITRPFYLAAHEVTVGQFRRFVEGSGYKTEAERDDKGGWGWNQAAGKFEQDPRYTWRYPGFDQTDQHPVVNVSWNDAQAYLGWLNEQEKERKLGYRLPTEAEWEYACRAGTRGLYGGSDDPQSLVRIANVADASFKKVADASLLKDFDVFAKIVSPFASIDAHDQEMRVPFLFTKPVSPFAGLDAEMMSLLFVPGDDQYVFTSPVGKFTSNAWQLYDMLGNVSEWCDDSYHSKFYQSSPVENPRNAAMALCRMIRGGSWRDAPLSCRPAARRRYTEGFRNNIFGFRVAAVQK